MAKYNIYGDRYCVGWRAILPHYAPVWDFSKSSRNKIDGLQSLCKQCNKAAMYFHNARKFGEFAEDEIALAHKVMSARQRAERLQRKPRWLKDYHEDEIKEIYRYRSDLNKLAGFTMFHVDHIIPLKGENVSGLHVPWNLQVITAKENLSKSNLLYES